MSYEPLLMELFPPAARQRQREVLIEMYRKGKIDEAVRTFRKIYLGIVDQFVDYLNTGDGRPPMLKPPSKKTSRDMADKAKRNRGLD